MAKKRTKKQATKKSAPKTKKTTPSPKQEIQGESIADRFERAWKKFWGYTSNRPTKP